MIQILISAEEVPEGFVPLSYRNGKFLCDGLVETLPATVIAAWHMDGSPAAPLDLTAYLEIAPDNSDGSRPTQYTQTHAWAGWNAHQA